MDRLFSVCFHLVYFKLIAIQQFLNVFNERQCLLSFCQRVWKECSWVSISAYLYFLYGWIMDDTHALVRSSVFFIIFFFCFTYRFYYIYSVYVFTVTWKNRLAWKEHCDYDSSFSKLKWQIVDFFFSSTSYVKEVGGFFTVHLSWKKDLEIDKSKLKNKTKLVLFVKIITMRIAQ